jgi:hypothetical protein
MRLLRSRSVIIRSGDQSENARPEDGERGKANTGGAGRLI